ncbi:MAG: protein kinase family protein [Dehalococcoidia bacterium]
MLRTAPDPQISDTEVLDVARRLLNAGEAVVTTWRIDPIAYRVVNPVSAGLFRVSGVALGAADRAIWSAVLKLVRPGGQSSLAPESVDYWRRESLVYASDLLAGLPEGFRAARCFGVNDRPDGTAGIWLEDVRDRFDRRWPLSHYPPVARHIGRFNGAYLAGRPLPADPWLSGGVMQSSAEQRGGNALAGIIDTKTWQHPLLLGVFPPSTRERLLRLWDDRGRLYAALSALPQTLCHFDLSRDNLFAGRRDDGSDETVAIDWAYPGIGALGADLSLLVPSPFFRCEQPADRLPEHAEAVFAAYVEGLRDAGWRGDARLPRLGYAAATALRTAFIAPTLAAALNERQRTAEEQRWQRPIAAILAQRAAVTSFLLDLADEAWTLLDRTG